MNPWDEEHVPMPRVWGTITGGWHMVYLGRNADGSNSLYYAQSPDGLTWTKCGAWDPQKHPAPPIYRSIEDLLEQTSAFMDAALMR